MKKNMPVTQHEVDYAESKVFVTKTDTRGVITYANDSFVDVSGFSREELLGKNHSLVRHPDMPEWAFKDMWTTLKSGHPWRGIVKNRTQSGGHYWVRATVSPITDQGVVVGYISLRKKPSRAEVMAAEALYKTAGITSVKPPLSKWFRNLTLQTKLLLLIQPTLLLMLGTVSFYVISDNRSHMMDSAQKQAEGISRELIDSANLLMATGQISDVNNRKLLLKKIADSVDIVGLRLMRSEQVDQQYGPGLPEEQIQDEVQRHVISNKQAYYSFEKRNGKPVFRAVIPYAISHDFHGTDCMACHQGESGSMSGVSDIQIDLSKSDSKLQKVIAEQLIIQLLFQLVLFFFIRMIVRRFVVIPVDEIKKNLNELINGQMTGQVDISGRDEMGEVLCAVQSTKVLLGSIIDQITSVSGHIDERAKHLSGAMTKVAEGSSLQSVAANSMALAIDKMTASIDQIAEHASEVRRVSDHSTVLAGEGGTIVQQVVDDMSRTNQAVMNAADTMRKLGEQSDQIQNVVKVIKEIADQTNLLALNAAIEAARAGEQGRGFAVVADEVRKLAEKTGNSTQEIAGMVEKIRASASHAITEMGVTVDMVKAGSAMAEKAGVSIVEINGGVFRVMNGIDDISSSIHEQSVVSREIAVNVDKVAIMSGENSAAVREVFNSVESLETLSGALDQSVRHFRI